MAHTDRDTRRVELHRHRDSGECTTYGCPTCDRLERGWRWWDWPEPSEWNREYRREERAGARNVMRRARAGHIDWDDMSIAYRRPYYW